MEWCPTDSFFSQHRYLSLHVELLLVLRPSLFQKRKKVYQKAIKNHLVSPVSRSTSGLPPSPHTTQSSAGGQVPQQKSVPNNNNITIGAQAKPAAAHLSSHAAGHALAVANPFLFGSAVSQPRFVEDRVPEFDWTLYLKHSKRKAVPHSAFKHVSYLFSSICIHTVVTLEKYNLIRYLAVFKSYWNDLKLIWILNIDDKQIGSLVVVALYMLP